MSHIAKVRIKLQEATVATCFLLQTTPEELFWLKVDCGLAFLDQHAGLMKCDREALLNSKSYWGWFLPLWLRADQYLRSDKESVLIIEKMQKGTERKELYMTGIIDCLKDMNASVWGCPTLIPMARMAYK